MAVYRGAVRIAKGVEPTLFQRAVGYTYEDEMATVFVPPEMRAIILWLAPRRPRGWKASMLATLRASADMSAEERQEAIAEFQRQYGDGR
jgi:hypothetical protein